VIVSGFSGLAQAQAIQVTDIRGRQVTLPKAADRLLIDDGRYLVALSLIHPNPVSVLAAWPHDVNRIGPEVYERFRAKFPAIDRVPQVASSAETFSLEQALAIKPAVAVFSLGRGPSDDQLRQFDALGIPVVFIDFFTKPFENQERSLLILGKLLGREPQAQAFVDFRRAHLRVIADRLKTRAADAPTVFLEAHAGISPDCCNSPGKGNVGDYVTFVGGHNIGADVLPGASGRLNLEYVLSRDPDVYIATGGPHLERTGGFVVGPGYSIDRSRQSLAKMAARAGISQLRAVRTGRTYGLSHQLLNSPLDLLAVEVLATWIHPDLFRDLHPEATLAEINVKFLAVPLEGPLWIALR
jgi:iron complex transport system substrate-binding protein